VHDDAPVLVTVTVPVMVPAAPWPWPGEAVMWLQPADAAVVDVAADVVDVVVEGADVVEVALWLVVVLV